MKLDRLLDLGAQVASGSVILNNKVIGIPQVDGTVVLTMDGESLMADMEPQQVVEAPPVARKRKAKADAADTADAAAEPADE